MKEKILKQGPANWNHGVGNKGGSLVLTNETLYFEAHKFNVGKKEYEVELEDITNVRTGFLNTLIVETNKGTESFVVNKKKDWVNSISMAVEEIKK